MMPQRRPRRSRMPRRTRTSPWACISPKRRLPDPAMSDHPDRDLRGVADGQYLVDITSRLPDAGGGVAAFAARRRDREAEPLMALRVDRHAPARPRHLTALTGG